MTDPKKPKNDLATRIDSYSNLITKLGLGQDKSSTTFFLSDRILGQTELAQIYEQDAIAARIVDRVVDDATRVQFELEDLNKRFDFGSVKSELEDLDALNQMGNAWRWSRLYGGALVVMAVNDGRKFDEPLDLSNATRLSALSVVDSTEVMPGARSPRLGSRAFANPEFYEVILPFGSERTRNIHRSRVLRFDGMKVPASRMIRNGGWGPSVLQRNWRDLKRLGSVMGYAENLLHEMSVMVLGLTDLRDMLCGSSGGEAQVKQLLESLKWGIDNLHILAIDKEMDDFHEVKRSVDGVAVLMDKFVDAIVRSTNMPRLIILGEQPSGLNASATGEIRAWFDAVSAEQEQVLTPALNRLLEVLLAVRRNDGEEVPDQWTISYESLVQEAPEQAAQTNFILAQTAQLLITNGIASPDEVRQLLVDRGAIAPLETLPDDELT